MKTLNLKRIETIRGAIRQIDRGLAYIMAPEIAICVRDSPATTTLHYARTDGHTLYEVAKHSSDFVAFETARRILEVFIEEATAPEKGATDAL